MRTDELSLAEFAADLHEVTLALGRRPVYEDPAKFFAFTFPTPPLRELVQDVAARLAGRSDKAVRRLELTYGGGKTHTLITLYHLFREPDALPDRPAVREFRAGGALPRAVPVSLCFDKIDVERGIDGVRGPNGETRTLRHPWSVLAFQLAGADGLRAIHGGGEAEERATPPAEPLLVALLERPQARGLSTLILVDEVLMYAREKAGADPIWRDRIVDFFQYLAQAVAKVDRAAMVASLLTTDPKKQRDETGQRLQPELFDVFRRQREEGVQPVRKEDVAEVLRRRFFEHDSLQNQDAQRAHVIAVVQRIAALDETTARNKADVERRFLESLPFHPDLTDVFYSRWTQPQGFQRTRGILRTLATALREAERWGDTSPLIGPAALLAAPGAAGISEAVRELAGVATSETTEGRKTDWATLLDAELQKARQIQTELLALATGREAEQAVVAVFLHSQPTGHKAQTPELRRPAGSTAPDAIELDKGLRRWRDVSWFLDDDEAGTADESGAPGLPKSWRLGNRPNLRQMHDEACRQRVTDALVDERLFIATRSRRPYRPATAWRARATPCGRCSGGRKCNCNSTYIRSIPSRTSACGGGGPTPNDRRPTSSGRRTRSSSRWTTRTRSARSSWAAARARSSPRSRRIPSARASWRRRWTPRRCCQAAPSTCGATMRTPGFVRDLAGAFTRQPRLPKMLQPRIALDTVMQGVERGLFVARLTRPDGSARTWWREPVDEEAHGDPQLAQVYQPQN